MGIGCIGRWETSLEGTWLYTISFKPPPLAERAAAAAAAGPLAHQNELFLVLERVRLGEELLA